jgi:hypothetical protein
LPTQFNIVVFRQMQVLWWLRIWCFGSSSTLSLPAINMIWILWVFIIQSHFRKYVVRDLFKLFVSSKKWEESMPHVLVTNTMTVYLLTLFYHIMYSTITCKTIMHLRLYTNAPILCFLVIFYNSATLGPTNVETLSLSGALLREWLICSNIFTESSFLLHLL